MKLEFTKFRGIKKIEALNMKLMTINFDDPGNIEALLFDNNLLEELDLEKFKSLKSFKVANNKIK